MGLLKRSAVHHGSIPVVKNINGQLCVVSQAEDYRYRGHDLLEYSLYEFVSATERRETKKFKKKMQKIWKTVIQNLINQKMMQMTALQTKSQLFQPTKWADNLQR